jgi:hypothetical protein
MKEMVASVRTRIANTSGHAVILEAGEPCRVPDALVPDARRAGAVETETLEKVTQAVAGRRRAAKAAE